MHPRRKGILLIVAAALLWSTGGIGIKAVEDPPLTVTFYRSLFAAIALFILFGPRVWARRRWRSTPAFTAAIISYGACLTTFVVATKWTTAANAIFLQYAGVVWVLLLAPVVLREPMRAADAIAIAVAVTGMALFFAGRFEAQGMNGNLMALLSSAFFAVLILALRFENDAGESAITWGNLALAAALLPFVAADLRLSPKSLAILLFLGLFQLAAAYVLFVRGLKYVTATEASLTGMLEPVANPLWVFLFLGERPSVFAAAGALIVLAAIGWHSVVSTPATEMPPPD
ncbi:MAG TPA: DMT family transporter [Thermoanaerobaculia bacterium]|nr:DMT family transporter [Thermoanaerobaculia bacterium]